MSTDRRFELLPALEPMEEEAFAAVARLSGYGLVEVEQVATRLDKSGLMAEYALQQLSKKGLIKREVEVRCGSCQGTFARYEREEDVPVAIPTRCQSCGAEVCLFNRGRPVYSPLPDCSLLVTPRSRPSALAESSLF